MQTDNETPMDPEQPPRHARTGSVPVTIDLTAERDDATPASEGAENDATEPLAEASAEAAEPVADEVAKTQEAKSQPSSPPPAARSGNSLVSGLIGGVIVLAGVAGLQVAGIWPGAKTDPALLEANTALASKLAAVEQQLAALPKPDSSSAQEALDRVAALETKLAETPASVSSDPARLAALTDQVTALQAALDQAVADADKARAALEMRLETTEKKVNEPRDDVDVARAIASAGLKAAIDRGGPFMAELETLSKIIPDDPAVVELKTFAASGVPSRAELMAQYPDVAIAILGALAQTDPDQGFFDRLSASAWSLVKVRPVGNVEGEGPDAIVARIETKLQNGDLKAAALEFDTLPDAGKAAAATFKAGLDARLRVEELVGGTLDRAMSGTKQAG